MYHYAHLGDSGMKRIPTPSITAQMSPIPTTVRQEAAPDKFLVPKEIKSDYSYGVRKDLKR